MSESNTLLENLNTIAQKSPEQEPNLETTSRNTPPDSAPKFITRSMDEYDIENDIP
jgi:hypothetical protein